MTKLFSTTLLTLALIGTGAQAATVEANDQAAPPEATHHQAMVEQLLPKLMAPMSEEDKAAPYDASRDCLLVSTYYNSAVAPACQIVLESGEYLPVRRGHTRFFINTPGGQLGPFATSNLMGAPVAQPYTRLYDHHEGNQTQLNDRM